MKFRSISLSNRRKLWLSAFITLLFAAVAGAISLCVWMRSQTLTPAQLARFSPSKKFYDANGTLIAVNRGGDYRWNIPVTLDKIPPELVADVLAIEDIRFYEHNGVDFRSLFRAALQCLRSRRIVSGASTITMQLVTQYTGRERTITYKLRQMGLAWNWERTHSKHEILEAYFNLLPYGGKIYGIETAAQYYFGRPAIELNRAEQLLLAGLPQGPAIYRPDRHPERALVRRDVALVILQRCGRITAAEAAAIQAMPLRYRDFAVPAWPHSPETQFLSLAEAQRPGSQDCHTALFPDVQEATRTALLHGKQNAPDVLDGAAVVIETKTGKVRALVGTLPTGDPRTSAVNSALARRSPGSALKPFIYGEAINGGIITADTILDDTPLDFTDYRPDNFDHTFRGDVPARTALASSLNTPAIRLLQRLTVSRMLRRLAPLKLFGDEVSETELESIAASVGMSFAIGGIETQLLALTSAYAAMGSYRGCSFLEDELPANDGAYWLPGTAEMLLNMLRRPIPGTDGRLDCAWKTGTSNGNRDAWCIAVTPEWTVGVWFGNDNGQPSPALVGAEIAAPVAGAIQQLLHAGAPANWISSDALTTQMLCAKSGLTPSVGCTELQPGPVVAGLPLRRCELCHGRPKTESPAPDLTIASPSPGTYYARADGTLTLPLRLSPSVPCHIYLNGEYLGLRAPGELLTFQRGSWQLLAWNEGAAKAATTNFTVK